VARSISVQFTGDVSRLLAAFAAAGSAGKAFGRTMDARMLGAGRSMTRGLTIPVVAGFGYAAKAAGDFETELNTFQAVSGATARQLQQVSSASKKLGADAKLPGASAADAAVAMTELAKGGLSVTDSMAAARGTLLLAAAAQTDNATAATIVADTLNAFGLAGKDAAMVTDLLAASANASTASIDDMAQGLKQASAVAKQAGVPVDQTTAALARLANAGIKGSDAGTSFKTMLMRLMAPAGAGAKKIKELGLELRDQQGRLKPLPALADEFTSKLKDMTPAQRDAAMAAIFGSDAIRAANVLLTKGGAAQEKMRKKVSEQGAAQKVAAAKMKGFNGAMEGFSSTMQTLSITLGTMLLPMLTSVLQWFTKLAAGIDGLSGPWRTVAIAALAFVAAAGPMLIVIGKIVAVLPALKAGIMAIGVAMKFAAANPIVLIIAGIVALAAALIYAYRNSATFRGVVQSALSAVASAASKFASAFRAVIGAFQAVISWVRSNWRVIVTIIAGPFAPLVALATDAFGIRSALIAAFQAVVSATKAAFQAVVAAIRAAMNAAVRTVTAVVGAITGAAAAVGRGVVTGIRNGIATLTAIASWIISKIAAGISTAASWARGAAVAIGRAIGEGIAAGISEMAGWVAQKARDLASGAINAAKSALGINSPSRVAKDQVGRPIGDGVARGLEESAGKVDAAAKKLAERARKAMTSRITAQKQAVRTAYERLASAAMKAFDDRTDELASRRQRGFDADAAGIDADQAALTPAEAEIQRLEDARAAARLVQGLADAERDLAAAQEEGDANAVAQAQRAVDDARLEQQLAGLKERAAAERAAQDAAAEGRRTALQEEIDTSTRHFEAMRQIQRDSLEAALETEKNKLLRGKVQQEQAQKEIIAMLAVYGVDYRAAGERLGAAFAKGLEDSVDAAASAADRLAGTVLTGTKINRAAKKGKVSDLMLAKVLAGNLPDLTAFSGSADGMAVLPPVPASTPTGGVGGRATVNVTVVDRTVAGMSREQARRLADDIAPELARRVTFAV